MGFDDLQTIKKEFFETAPEFISIMEQNFLLLEQDKENKDCINEIFRAFHTLKGNAGLAGEKEINEICHVGESILDLIRKDRAEFTDTILEAFLKTVDVLREIIESQNASCCEEKFIEALTELKTLLESCKMPETKASTFQKAGDISSRHKENWAEETLLKAIHSLKNFDINLANLNKPDKYWDAIDNLSLEGLMLNDVIPTGSSLKKLAEYLEKTMTLINRSGIATYDKWAFEILFTIFNDLKTELLPIIKNSSSFASLALNSPTEINCLKQEVEKLTQEKKAVIIEINIPYEELRHNQNIFLEFIKLKKGRNGNLAFISHYTTKFKKASEWLHDVLQDMPIIHDNYYNALYDLIEKEGG